MISIDSSLNSPPRRPPRGRYRTPLPAIIRRLAYDRQAVGVGLVFAGLPVAWVVRWAVGRPEAQSATVAVLALGLALTVSVASVVNRHGLYLSPASLLPVYFLFPVSLWAFTAGRAVSLQAGFGMMFAASFLLALATVPPGRLTHLPLRMTQVAWVSCTATLAAALGREPLGMESQRLQAGLTNSPNQVSFVAGLLIVAWAAHLARHRTKQVEARFGGGTPGGPNWQTERASTYRRLSATVAVGSVAGAVLLLSRTRSTLIGLAVCMLAALLRKVGLRIRGVHDHEWRKMPHWIAAATLMTLAVGVSSLAVAHEVNVREAATLYATYVVRGANTLLGFGGPRDPSAAQRVQNIARALSGMTWLGHGVGALRVDVPPIQAFYDLGVLGGVGFSCIVLIIPLLLSGSALLSPKVTSSSLFVVYVWLFYLPSLLLHGDPYGFSTWLPVVMLYAVYRSASSPTPVPLSDLQYRGQQVGAS